VKKRAGIARCALHELRHTFATLLKDLAVEKSIIGALLGHAAEDVTDHYAKVRLARMRAALDELAPLLKRAACPDTISNFRRLLPALLPTRVEMTKPRNPLRVPRLCAAVLRGAGNRIRTGDLLLGKEMLYH